MPILHLTDEQAVALLRQLPEEQMKRVLARVLDSAKTEKRPRFGSAKDDILYMAEDFDAPLEEVEEYA
jgi:hypothetical protein